MHTFPNIQRRLQFSSFCYRVIFAAHTSFPKESFWMQRYCQLNLHTWKLMRRCIFAFSPFHLCLPLSLCRFLSSSLSVCYFFCMQHACSLYVCMSLPQFDNHISLTQTYSKMRYTLFDQSCMLRCIRF